MISLNCCSETQAMTNKIWKNSWAYPFSSPYIHLAHKAKVAFLMLINLYCSNQSHFRCWTSVCREAFVCKSPDQCRRLPWPALQPSTLRIFICLVNLLWNLSLGLSHIFVWPFWIRANSGSQIVVRTGLLLSLMRSSSLPFISLSFCFYSSSVFAPTVLPNQDGLRLAFLWVKSTSILKTGWHPIPKF